MRTKPSPGGLRAPQASSAEGVEGEAYSGYSTNLMISVGTSQHVSGHHKLENSRSTYSVVQMIIAS